MKDLYYETPEKTTQKIPTLLRFVGFYVSPTKKRNFILQILYVTRAKLELATFSFIKVHILFTHLAMRE